MTTARIEMSANRAKLLAAGGVDLSLKKLGSLRLQTRAWRLISDAKGAPVKLVSILEVECRLPGCDTITFNEDIEAAADADLAMELHEAIGAAVKQAFSRIPTFIGAAKAAWIEQHVGPGASTAPPHTPAKPRRLREAAKVAKTRREVAHV